MSTWILSVFSWISKLKVSGLGAPLPCSLLLSSGNFHGELEQRILMPIREKVRVHPIISGLSLPFVLETL